MRRPRVFLDTSAWVKCYLREDGSEQVQQRLASSSEVMISHLGLPELFSIFQRLARNGKIETDQYRALKTAVVRDLDGLTLLPVDEAVIRLAVECIEKAAVRSFDAVHISTAIAAGSDLFISSDEKQAAAAKKMGLKVEVIGL